MAVAAVQAVSLSLPVLTVQRVQAAEANTETSSVQTENGRSSFATFGAQVQAQAQDTTGPQVTFTSPAAGAIVGDTDLEATISDSSKVDRYWFSVTGPKSWETRTWNVNQKNVQVDINLCFWDKPGQCRESKLPSGTYTVRATAYDERGNVSNTATTSFVFDADGPAVNITNPASDASVNKVLVSGTIADQKLSYFNLELSKVGDKDWDFSTQDYPANGNTTYTLSNLDLHDAAFYGKCAGWPCWLWWGNVPPLPDGLYTLRVNAYDKFDNRTTYEHNFTLDTKKPTAPTLVSPDHDALVSTQTATLANVWNSVADAAQYRYQTYGLKNNGACNPQNVLSTELYTATQTSSRTLAEGSFCWGVTAIDAAGNESPSSPLWKLTVDNTSPVVELSAPVDGDLLRGMVTISGVATDVNLDYYSIAVVDGNGNVVAYQEDVANLDWDTTLDADGEYTIYLEASDKAGNSSSTSLLVTVDNTVPVVSVEDLETLATSPKLTGEVDDPNAVVFVTVDGVTYEAEVDGNIWTLPAGVISPALAVGTYTVEVTAVDLAGNSASQEATLTVKQPLVTPTNPTVPVVTVVSVTAPQVFGTAIRTLAQNNSQTQTETTTPQVASASTIADTSGEKEKEEAKKPATEAASDKKNNTWIWLLGVAAAILLILALLYRRFSKALDK